MPAIRTLLLIDFVSLSYYPSRKDIIHAVDTQIVSIVYVPMNSNLYASERRYL